MYAKFCFHFYIKKKRSELKSDRELQESAKHSVWTKQEVNVCWRKLLDMELHELHHSIDTLVKNWRATVTKGTETTDNIEEKRKT